MLVLDYHQLLAISLHGSKHDQRSNGASLSVEGPRRDGAREPDWGVADACVEAMGQNGNGFVAVKGMSNYVSLRSRLLRLAQKLALMPNLERAAILKEHGLGTDVPLKDPGRPVSSFAAQLRLESSPEIEQIGPASSDDCSCVGAHWSSHGDSFSDLGRLFKQLGMCMVEVGLMIARLCDAARSSGSMREARLEEAILESGTAKGRLIHYHSLLEQEIFSSLQKDLRKEYNQNKSAPRKRIAKISTPDSDSAGLVSDWWQQWHCDYGVFTILTSPLFLKPLPALPLDPGIGIQGSCCLQDASHSSCLYLNRLNLRLLKLNSSRLIQQQCDNGYEKAEMEEKPQRIQLTQVSSSPSHLLDLRNSAAQERSSPDGHSSLMVRDSHGRTTSLVIPSDYLIVQVGEAAQLLSGGELVARAHCVMRPTSANDVSRETMAVFLQPAWDKRMSLPPGVPQERALEAGVATNLETHIPLLASRWKDGCTFAELSKETTRQYYGADGNQSRR